MASDPTYDVFLSHASPDKPAVEELARRLKHRKLKPFLDKWHLVPGEPWQEALEEALKRSRTFVVFLGPSGIRPWQNEEMRTALATRARDKNRRVIPVLLPDALMPEDLPPFLARLTWVDFRGGLDDPQALHRLVCGIKGIPPEGGPAPFPSTARPTMIGVPHRNPFFTGREELLARLHQQLQGQGISTLAQAAIHGLGGIGKTQTAIEYAHRFGGHYRFVLWVMAESEAALRTSYLSIARELALIEAQADLETAIRAMKGWLSREVGWFLVFDNADDPALVRPYLPPIRTDGKILLTSRAKSFVKVGIREPFRVETLDLEDAVKFLTERSGNTDAQAAAELAAELGCLPLALEQAAAYIETVGGSFAEYLSRYRRQGLALLAKAEPSTDYPKTVATTWTLSFDAVREVSPASAELLTAAAFLAPDSIPIEIFTWGHSEFGAAGSSKKGGGRVILDKVCFSRGRQTVVGDALSKALVANSGDKLGIWELLAPLESYSLVERLPDEAFKLHRLTQEVLKNSLDEVRQRAWAEQLVRALNAAYPLPEFESWRFCERLQPNMRAIYELTRTYKMESAEIGRLFNLAGAFLLQRGIYAEAKSFTESSLEIFERILGGDHHDTLTSRSNLASTLHALGDLAGARELFERNLEIRKRLLGGEHPDTVTSRAALASTLHSLGDLVGARELLEQNLAIMRGAGAIEIEGEYLQSAVEWMLNGEHPDIVNSRAAVLLARGDLAGARELQEQTLDFQEIVLGQEHPETLMSRNNLAETCYALGDLAGARELHQRNVEIVTRVLGGDHPNTLLARQNLAAVLSELGDLAGARKLHEQTLEIQERVLGREHPNTTNSTWSLLLTVCGLNDPDAEAHLIDKLRWLLDCDEDSIPSALQRTIRQRLVDFLNPP
ncbi:MAG: hypothetical protein QOF89_4254 [Acidobacteriota bacterium]|jgi:tetratricopeptide (TPR) repeat protein|nr:hypothetical protein [Acidobacteriota bacterium]